MREFIARHATGKKVLFLVIVTAVIFGIMHFYTVPKVSGNSKKPMVLDMMPTGYDYCCVLNLFDSLGDSGRNAYLTQQIPIDLVFPFLFALSGCLLLVFLFKKMEVKNENWYYLCLVPVVAGIFDYLENFGTIRLLLNYPEISKTQVAINSYLTILKFGFIILTFLILIISFIIFALKKKKST